MFGKKFLGINKARKTVILMGMLFLGLLIFFMSQGVIAADLTVHPTATSADHTTIQDAINASSNGDTIRVWNGTYAENITVNKSISLDANSSVFLDLNGISGYGVNITANNTVVQNITVSNCSNVGIWVYNSSSQLENVTLENVTVHNGGGAGIAVDNASFCNITGCNVDNVSVGVFLGYGNVLGLPTHCNDCNVSDTMVSNIASMPGGICLYNSSDNTIYNNTVYNVSYMGQQAVAMGIALNGESTRNNITLNEIYISSVGIGLASSNNTNVSLNNIHNNFYGIYSSSSTGHNISDNSFYDDGIYLTGSELSHYIHTINAGNTVGGYPIRYYKNNTGSIVLDENNDAGQVILVNCSNFEIRNMTFNKSVFTTVHLVNSDNVNISNCTLTNFSNFGVGITVVNSNYCNITNCSDINGQSSVDTTGISFTNSSNCTIRDNIITNMTYDGAGPEAYGVSLQTTSNDNSIINNTVSFCGSGGIAIVTNSSNNTILSNTIFNSTEAGKGIFLVSGACNNSILENTIYNTNYSIHVQKDRGGWAGLPSIKSNNNTIDNNTIYHNIDHGLILEYSDNNTISNNIINNTTNGYGVYLYYSNYTNFTDNSVYNNSDAGIDLDGSCNNILSSNFVYNNENDGIRLSSSSNNSLFENYVYDNLDNGVQLNSAENNTIYHNNIYGNNNQNGFDDSQGNNTWYNDTYSEGNYWGDYPGTDSSNDGIGDTEYTVTTMGGTDNNDSYPLINKYGSIKNLNTNEVFLTIQNAIDDTDTVASHTISIDTGTYRENIILDKELTLTNALGATPVIDGMEGYGINITTNNTLVQNISVTNCSSGLGIYVFNSTHPLEDITLENITIDDANLGVGVDNTTYFNITDSTIFNCPMGGILLGFREQVLGLSGYCTNCNLSDNTVRDVNSGIFIRNSSDNEIYDNTIYDAGIGIAVYYSNNSNNVSSNQVYNNSDKGIWFYNSDHNNISSNNVYNNSNIGILFQLSSNGNNVTSNEVHNNTIGIKIQSSSNYNNITENTVEDNTDYGIYLNSFSSHNNLTNNECHNNSNYDIYLNKGCNYNILSGNNCTSSSGSYGIYLHDGNGVADSEHNTLINNICNGQDNRQKGIYIHSSNNTLTNNTCNDNFDGIYIVSSSDVNVTNNTCNSNGNYGIHILSSSGNNLTNNTCNDNSLEGIYMTGSSDNIIDNNTICRNKNGILLTTSTNNTFSNNTASNNSLHGLNIQTYSNNNTFLNNTLENNSFGIYLRMTLGNVILDNNSAINNSIGIYIHYSDECNIGNNICNNNTNQGICLSDSINNTVFNNTASDNGNQGIWIKSDSNNNIVKNNTVENNSNYGIHVSSSTSNTIYNNYLNNTQNAYDDSTNTWNTTQQAGTNIIEGSYLAGNYYGDYSGLDANDDGIGDTTYSIAGGNNIDYLPLSYGQIYVDDNAPADWYDEYHVRTIQEGINNATSTRTTVYIWNGTYTENVTLNKSITLDANSSSILDLQGSHSSTNCSGINITANNTVVQDLTVKNCSLGIHVYNSSFMLRNVTLNNLTVYNCNNVGICIDNTTYCNISSCNVTESGVHGISFAALDHYDSSSSHCSYCNVSQSSIKGRGTTTNNRACIYVTNSSHIEIYDNTIYNSSDWGIEFENTNNSNNITSNTIYNNSDKGIYIENSHHNNISANTIFNNTNDGINIEDSSNNTVFKNSIYNNSNGTILDSSENNTIYHNNFYNNTINNASDDSQGNNTWYNDIINEGNYWGDYDEASEGAYDNNSDGIVDDPDYNVSKVNGEYNNDTYPLMYRYDNYYILSIDLSSSRVDEGDPFTVTVKTQYGRTVSNANVTFNSVEYNTNPNGKVTITAPSVSSDSDYDINASKMCYTSDFTTIRVENVPSGGGFPDIGDFTPTPGDTSETDDAPTISDVSHSPIPVTNNDTVTVSASVTDDNTVSSVILYWDDGSEQSKSMSGSDDSYTANIGPFEGLSTVYYWIEATDNASQTTESEENSFKVKDTTGPVITIVSPTLDEILYDTSPRIQATYTDVSGIDTDSVVLSLNGSDTFSTISSSFVTYTPASSLDAGDHTVVVTVSDTIGNENSKVWTFTIEESESYAEEHIDFIDSGEEETIHPENAEETGITNIALISTVDLTDVQISVAKIDVNPDNISEEPTNAYIYLDITMKSNGTEISDDDIESLNLSFKLTQDWFDDNNINKDKVKLLRYHAGVWQTLTTTMTSEDDSFAYFEATTNGTSTYAIVGEQVEEDDTPQPFGGLLWLYILLVIITIIIIVFVILVKTGYIYFEIEE